MEMRLFYGKLILFGEYSMIFDSTALLIPLKHLAAHWEKSGMKSTGLQQSSDHPSDHSSEHPFDQSSNTLLRGFCKYLEKHEILSGEIDTPRFLSDLEEGWELTSNIPFGAGFGSSGSVAAAVYDRYAVSKTDDSIALRKQFAMMESYYHGTSSGIDPLQSYLGRPFISSREEIKFVPDDLVHSGIRIGLIDTGIQRNTKPLVEYFTQQRQNTEYLNAFEEEYTPCAAACISTFLQGDHLSFFKAIRELSSAQLKYLGPMIPDSMKWLFDTDPDFHFGIKILGAGGGGYMLVFTDDPAKSEELLAGHIVRWI